MAEKVVPSPPADHMFEAIHNPTQFTKRIVDQQVALSKDQSAPITPRPSGIPAPPSMADVLKEKK
jgi:hypothetical protein